MSDVLELKFAMDEEEQRRQFSRLQSQLIWIWPCTQILGSTLFPQRANLHLGIAPRGWQWLEVFLVMNSGWYVSQSRLGLQMPELIKIVIGLHFIWDCL